MATIATPCIHVCVLHPATQLCAGCGRTLGEIARWTEMTEVERERITMQLPARLAALTTRDSGANFAAATA